MYPYTPLLHGHDRLLPGTACSFAYAKVMTRPPST